MRTQVKNFIICLLLSMTGIYASSQENFAVNVSTSVSEGEKLIITYDINETSGAKSFSVILLVTSDGKQVKASAAYGDIGSNVGPGKEKAIVWYFKDDFDGDIGRAKIDVFAYKENEPQAIFQIASTGNNGYAPSEVVFLNRSTFANEYRWDFGDPSSGAGNISFEKDPKHTYQRGGVYSISLVARNTQINMENTYYQSIEIKTHDPVTADFTIEGNNQKPKSKVNFINRSNNADTYSWNFGDPGSGRKNRSSKENETHKYKSEGIYRVELIVRNSFSGLSDTVVKEVTVGQVATAKAAFIYTKSVETAPSTVVFKNTSENADRYEWNFGDPDSGNKNRSEDADPAHVYSKPGSYKVELSAWSGNNKKAARYSETITIAELPKPPQAGFSIQNNNVLGPVTVIFKNNSVNAKEYLWDFGDPESGNENRSNRENPTHTYRKEGSYTVSLTASSPGFSVKSTAKDVVVILGSSKTSESPVEKTAEVTPEKPVEQPVVKQAETPVEEPALPTPVKEPVVAPPVAGFELVLNSDLVPAKADFKNLSENADSYRWNFGDFDSDRNESADNSPSHNYTVPGKYIITLEASNTKTGKTHKVSKEITLKSNFITFIRSDEFKGDYTSANSLVQVSDNEYIVLLKSKSRGSSVIKVDNKGKIADQKKLDYDVYNIVNLERKNDLMMTGLDESGKLMVQSINSGLKTGAMVVFQLEKNYSAVSSFPKLAFSKTNEVGVIANTLNDRYPIDILFQKADKSGRIITLADRTFKYVGTKLATDFVPTMDGGFALTGYWQEKDNSPKMMLFGKIDRKGHGEMHLIRSQQNVIGCDIEESYQGGYAVLRAKESEENSDLFEISFILINADGGPTDCANMLPCSIKKEDILKYRPVMIRTADGYLVASHRFNGLDYDIALFWIDRTGEVLIRYVDITLPGDQFVHDLLQTTDGGFLISGEQRVRNDQKAIVIKTDPFGKLN
jgi:PKD repeat protein